MDGIHDLRIREVCAFHGPWEVRIAGDRRGPSLQLYWPELGLSLLTPSPLTRGVYDCWLEGTRWRAPTWNQTVESLGLIADALPSLARLRAWSRWHAPSRANAAPGGEAAAVIPLGGRRASDG